MDNDKSLTATIEDEIFNKVQRLTSCANLLEQTAKNQEKTYIAYQEQYEADKDLEHKDRMLDVATLMVQNLTEALAATNEVNELMTSIKLPSKIYLQNIERVTALLENAKNLLGSI